LDYSEKDIENHIMEYELLWDKFQIRELTNQFPTEYGVIDILGYEPKSKRLIVVELKKGTVDENAVGQIMKYMSAMKEIAATFKSNPDLPIEIQEIVGVAGLLMGTNATPGVHAITRAFGFIKYIELDVMLQIHPMFYVKQRREESLSKDVQRFIDPETGMFGQIQWASAEYKASIDVPQSQE
jgi:hypothetical protein